MPPCELRKMHAQQSEQKNQQGVSTSTKSDAKNMHSSYTPCSHSKLKKQVLLASPISLPCVANNILQDNEKESRTTPIQEGWDDEGIPPKDTTTPTAGFHPQSQPS